MSEQKCYSLNDEDFTYDELDDAITDAFDDSTIDIGSEIIVFEGDAVKFQAGDFTGFNLDSITNSAYDEGGEYSESYLEGVTKEQEADLDKRVADAVNQWADDHGLQPNFYRVANVKKIRVKMVDKSGNYEILTD